MTQEQLELAVARATGESLAEIRRRGFSPLDPLDTCFETPRRRTRSARPWTGMNSPNGGRACFRRQATALAQSISL